MKHLRDVDVLVVGGGPAGIGAALAAARAGADTLLLERHAFLGGVGAFGMGMGINQMRPSGHSRGAVHELVIEHLSAYGTDALTIPDHAIVCNVEYLKAALMDALDSVGCAYLLHAPVVDAIVEHNRVAGAVVGSKEGLLGVSAKVTVDATGDADVAYLAGAQTLKGRETDGFLSPMTLCFIISNVDVEAVQGAAREAVSIQFTDEARATYPLIPDGVLLERGPFPLEGCLVINHAGTRQIGSLDATQLPDIIRAEKHSRHQIIQIVQALREFGGPAFADIQLAAAAPQVGVRETRRLDGLYLLTEEDAMEGRRFDDAVAWRSGYLDIGWTRWEPMKIHDVPYRALLPKKMDGLLASGRCISATHVGLSAGKSMGNCMATGHASGLAAALSAARGIQPRDLDVNALRLALAADGVDLERREMAG